MRARVALAALCMLALARPAAAVSPTITEPRDEAGARRGSAAGDASRATFIPVAIGGSMVLAMSIGPTESWSDVGGRAAVAALGIGAAGLGILLGPEVGWMRLHRARHGLAGVAARTAIVAGGIAWGVQLSDHAESGAGLYSGAVISAAALLALGEGVFEIHQIGRAERGRVSLQLVPVATPGGAGLALVGRY